MSSVRWDAWARPMSFPGEIPCPTEARCPAMGNEMAADLSPKAHRILVVDDDAYVRALVIKVLATRGYSALAAADAWQATDILRQQSVDLIILDLRMPGPVDGEQLLFSLRDQGNEVPVIVLSGYVDEDASLFPPDCVHAVLRKPLDVEAFADLVDEALATPESS